MQPLLEHLQRLTLLDRHLTHNNGLATVDFTDDTMHHQPRLRDLAVLEGGVCALDGVRAVERAGQRRVQVDDGCLADDVEEAVAQNVHPAREHDDVRARLDDELRDRPVVVVPRRPRVRFQIRLEREIGRRDGRACGRCARQAIGVLAVGDDSDDRAGREGGCVEYIDEGLQVRPYAPSSALSICMS